MPEPDHALSPPRDWTRAYEDLLARDRQQALTLQELEQLGIVAYLSGEDATALDVHTRAHHLALERGDQRQAIRSAYWITFAYIHARELVRAGGWIARTRRLLDEHGGDLVESGYLLGLEAVTELARGDLARAEQLFTAAEQIGERFGDRDLINLSRQGRGRMQVMTGRVGEGLLLLDETMAAVTAGDVSPLMAGIVYCSVISACFDIFDIRRAQEWTEALTDWCGTQRGLVPYRGECLANRAEVFRLRGEWAQALDTAERAYETLVAAKRPGPGSAAYAVGELCRLLGRDGDAERAYQRAGEHGRAPQPGLALLRLAQGKTDLARGAIDRAVAETTRFRQRAELLMAAVEVCVSAGDCAAASTAAEELAAMADRMGSEWLQAMAATCRGAIAVAQDRPHDALLPLREALGAWSNVRAPYDAARVRVLIGRACRALGDFDGARLEWLAAADEFRTLGAAPDLAVAEALLREPPQFPVAVTSPLTAREVEVIQLIAQGGTNRAIARTLRISEKTVARHVSNIFLKLDVSTRSAATAYAFTHGLVAPSPAARST